MVPVAQTRPPHGWSVTSSMPPAATPPTLGVLTAYCAVHGPSGMKPATGIWSVDTEELRFSATTAARVPVLRPYASVSSASFASSIASSPWRSGSSPFRIPVSAL
jgi:hypothetical protein